MEGYNPLIDIAALGIPVAAIAAYLAWDWFCTKLQERKQ